MKKAKDMCVSAQSNVNGREENGMLTMKKLEETFEGIRPRNGRALVIDSA